MKLGVFIDGSLKPNMGTGASKKPKVENKQLKPARSKLMAAVALAKPGAVPGLCPL